MTEQEREQLLALTSELVDRLRQLLNQAVGVGGAGVIGNTNLALAHLEAARRALETERGRS